MYVFQAYPKWKYHPEKEPVIVQGEVDEAALGELWVDHPDLVMKADACAVVELTDAPKRRARKSKPGAEA